MPIGRRGWCRRATPRGNTLQGLLIILAGLGALTATAVVVGPRYLRAGSSGLPSREAVPAAHPTHQALIEDLARLMRRCVGVLAIHPRAAGHYEEVVLWLTDDDPDGTAGRPDARELAVLSHSRVMQTITIYRREERPGGTTVVSPDTVAFCDGWRADPDVAPTVLARGIRDMRVEPVGDPQDAWGAGGAIGGFVRLELTLAWADDAAHGPDRASALVDTVMFPAP